MTILDACIKVLSESGQPLTAEAIYNEIQRRKLYDFKAKDPRNMVRSTLSKHLRGTQAPRIRQVDPNRFEVRR
jgi:hypothetical protein